MGLKSLPLMPVDEGKASKELHEEEYAFDDQSGEALDPELVKLGAPRGVRVFPGDVRVHESPCEGVLRGYRCSTRSG